MSAGHQVTSHLRLLQQRIAGRSNESPEFALECLTAQIDPRAPGLSGKSL
jgi:hypothetical protein